MLLTREFLLHGCVGLLTGMMLTLFEQGIDRNATHAQA
jgi:hypothetical protein